MLVVIVLFCTLLFMLWKSNRKPSRLPPGRWGLPLVGYVPLTTKAMEEQVIDLHKQHGAIVMWRMGVQKMVFLSDYKLLKEALSKPGNTERPEWESFKFFGNSKKGLAFSNGSHWHKNRKLTAMQLRNHELQDTSRLVEMIQQQALNLRKAIGKEAGTPTQLPHQQFVTIINVIWQLVASKQFDAEDKKCKEFVNLMNEIVILSNRVAILDFLPWLKNILPNSILKRLSKHKEMVLVTEKFYNYFYEEIEKHRSTLDPDNPRDLIDGYLLDMEKKKDDPDTIYNDDDLACLIQNMFFGGTETLAITFKWICCYLAAHPNIQHKMHAEIDTILPKGTLPTLADKPKMPYTEAIINEVMRVSSVVNFGLQHKASTDLQLGDYIIPKGAILNCSTTSIHHNTRYWDQPEVFSPERWLDDNGKFTSKKEGFVTFSVGRRFCIGESLGRTELFIITATVFQNFSISPPAGKTIDLTPYLHGFFFRQPRFNEFVFTERKY